MKIVFLTAGYENLAVEYLSSFLQKEGHETSLVFDPLMFSDCYYDIPSLAKIFNFTPRIIKEVISQKPDLIAISAITPFYRWGLHVSEKIKEKIDVPIIFGSIHASAVPDRVIKNKSIDMVCIGEGEDALLDVVKALEKNDTEKLQAIPNIWYKNKNGKIYKNNPRPLKEDIDYLPFPDKEMFLTKSKFFQKRYMAITSRGCIFNCSYCSNNVWRNVYRVCSPWKIRRRSIKNVIEELKIGVEKWHPKLVNFVDDAFDMDKKWIREFAVEYKNEIGLPFTSFAHPKFVDRELTKMLKKAGLIGFELGVQSLNENIKRDILQRYETNEEAINAMKIMKENKVSAYVDFMIGLPQQTEKDLQYAARVFNKLKPEKINCFGLEYFPKSQIIDTSIKYGLIDKESIEKIEEGHQTGFLLGGDVKNAEMFNKYRILFTLLPNISYKKGEKLINSLDKIDITKKIYPTIAGFATNLFRDDDKMYRIFIGYYMEFLWKFITGRAQ
jgi:radical SAM superfamily enzyme YgiQ (UPF0313 family)